VNSIFALDMADKIIYAGPILKELLKELELWFEGIDDTISILIFNFFKIDSLET